MANFNFADHPVIESLRQNQEVNIADLNRLQQSVANAVRDNRISRQQRNELRGLIQRWLSARQNVEVNTRNSLDAMHRALERGWGEATQDAAMSTVDTIASGATVLAGGARRGVSTAFESTSSFLARNLDAEGNSTIKRVGVFALAAAGGAALVAGLRRLWRGISSAPKRAIAAILGGGVILSGFAGLTPWARAREGAPTDSGNDEASRLTQLQSVSGAIPVAQIENLNLLASQLQGRTITLAPGLDIGFVNGTEGTTNTTNLRVGTRTFSLTADGTLGNLSTRFRNEPTTLRLSGAEATLSVNNGAEVRYIARADLVAALTRVQNSPVGTADVVVDVPTRRQAGGAGAVENVRLTFKSQA